MNATRFASLAEAYGGDLRRWPAAVQDEARDFLDRHPDARPLLAAASDLDTMLASWTVPAAGAALHARIVAAATSRGAHVRRLRLWFSSLGAAAVLAGGVAAGVAVVELASDPAEQATGSLYELSVLGAPLDLPERAAVDGSL